jgi:hypothetical protein
MGVRVQGFGIREHVAFAAESLIPHPESLRFL